MQSLYQFLKSVRLAVVLILLITALSVLATLIPQNQDPTFYYRSYSPAAARLILALKMDRFFSSFLFLAPVALFFLNLAVCAADRLVTRARLKAKKRYGPDLIHIGLLLLIVGALLTLQGRKEGTAYLGEGDRIGLPGDYELEVLSFKTFLYEDGRPKDWISMVAVSREGQAVVPSFAIEVNRPLKVAGLSIYQTSFAQEDRAVLKADGGESFTIASGKGMMLGEAMLFFRGIEGREQGGSAVFERWEGHTRTATYRAQVAGRVGDFTLETLSSRELTGLKVVKDPGFPVVVVSLIVVTLGLTLTYIQKRRDLAV